MVVGNPRRGGRRHVTGSSRRSGRKSVIKIDRQEHGLGAVGAPCWDEVGMAALEGNRMAVPARTAMTYRRPAGRIRRRAFRERRERARRLMRVYAPAVGYPASPLAKKVPGWQAGMAPRRREVRRYDSGGTAAVGS